MIKESYKINGKITNISIILRNNTTNWDESKWAIKIEDEIVDDISFDSLDHNIKLIGEKYIENFNSALPAPPYIHNIIKDLDITKIFNCLMINYPHTIKEIYDLATEDGDVIFDCVEGEDCLWINPMNGK